MQAEGKLHYRQHKAIFQKIPANQRSAWTKTMLQIPQKTGEYPIFKQEYPSHGKWTYKGIEHHYYFSLSEGKPTNAILISFHGLNAHGNGSGYFTQNIAKVCPIDIYALDFKNFGRSGGEDRGYIESLTDLVEQAEQFVNYIISIQKEKKRIFISGLSMGGAVCFKLGIRHPQRYDGVIFLSPALKENKEAQPFMKKIGRCIGSWFPKTKLVQQKFTEACKVNQTQLMMQDPYVYKDKVVPGSIRALLQGMEEIEKEWSKFTLPFLLIQSGVDKMVDPFLGIDFEKESSSKDKTVVYWKDMWHSVYNEDQMPEVVEAASQWLASRLK